MNNGNDDAAERLRDALQSLAENLQPLIERAFLEGNNDTAQALRRAKSDLENSASNVDAGALCKLFAGNPDLAKLSSLSNAINAKAVEIASQEKNLTRIIAIAAGALDLATAVGSKNVAGVLTAVGDIEKNL